MRRLLPLSLLLLATDAGHMALAQQPVPAPNRPRESTISAATADPAPERRSLFGRFRRPSPTIPTRDPRVPSPPDRGRVRIAPPQNPPAPAASRPGPEGPVRRVQAGPGDLGIPPTPGIAPSVNPVAAESGQSLSLQAALYGALTGNPDLVSLRAGNVQGNVASPEAVEVARRFPTTLNPTLWVDVRPFANERIPGGIAPNGQYRGPGVNHKDALYYFSLRQPIELGHQTRYRYAIAKAALTQQQWTVLQAELLALVQTYRFFQTAAYNREKLHVAHQLADFNDQLLVTLKRRFQANQVPADVVALGEIEGQASRQLVKAAKQAYARALTDLRNQIGVPATAGTAEPLGEFILPTFIPEVDDQEFVQTALRSRPEIQAARAQVEGARAATGLARADRIPTPVVGPVYERDEQGTQFFGFVYITPLPIVNNGMPLVRQREAEYRRACVALEQIQQRTVSQVKAAVANWNEANELSRDTQGMTAALKKQVSNLERLFEAGQTDLTKLLQGRQRLIQLENARLDAVWQASLAQADLLTALGAPTLIGSLQHREEGAAGPATSVPSPVPPNAGSPFR